MTLVSCTKPTISKSAFSVAPANSLGSADVYGFELEETGEVLRYPQPYVDSNSPSFWVDDETRCVVNSQGRYETPKLFCVDGFADFARGMPGRELIFVSEDGSPAPRISRWIESVVMINGTLYGWYHHEPESHLVCPGTSKTAPQIGALVSYDKGKTWRDLGIVMRNSEESLNCRSPNLYFAEGVGDFTAIEDYKSRYIYFLYSNYSKNASQQGIAIARISFEDLENPIGKVKRFYNGQWTEDGLGGFNTPILKSNVSWHRPDSSTFWGPSIHWNVYLESYVMVAATATDSNWNSAGSVILFSKDLSDFKSWSDPISTGVSGWYQQIVGQGSDFHGTDKLSNEKSRLYQLGALDNEVAYFSKYNIVFTRSLPPDENSREIPFRIAGIAAIDLNEQRYNFFQWSYFYQKATGFFAPDYSELGFDLAEAEEATSFEEWWARFKPWHYDKMNRVFYKTPKTEN